MKQIHSLLEGRGCPKCTHEERCLNNNKFLKKVKKVHGSKYNYPNLRVKSSEDVINIECPEHGIFKQRVRHHLAGKGCKECGKMGWSNTDWEKAAEISSNFDSFKVYIIKLKKGLFKVGKTFRVIEKRAKRIPYDIEVLYTLEFDSAQKASDTEEFLKILNKENQVTPKKEFGGMYECYSSITPIIKYLDLK